MMECEASAQKMNNFDENSIEFLLSERSAAQKSLLNTQHVVLIIQIFLNGRDTSQLGVSIILEKQRERDIKYQTEDLRQPDLQYLSSSL
jgi:hypothetical protein